jgi:hypothetical protein
MVRDARPRSSAPPKDREGEKLHPWELVNQAASETYDAIEQARPYVEQLMTEQPQVDRTVAYRALRRLRSASLGLSRLFSDAD